MHLHLVVNHRLRQIGCVSRRLRLSSLRRFLRMSSSFCRLQLLRRTRGALRANERRVDPDKLSDDVVKVIFVGLLVIGV